MKVKKLNFLKLEKQRKVKTLGKKMQIYIIIHAVFE